MEWHEMSNFTSAVYDLLLRAAQDADKLFFASGRQIRSRNRPSQRGTAGDRSHLPKIEYLLLRQLSNGRRLPTRTSKMASTKSVVATRISGRG
jgi:hypothetical protein